MKKGSIFEVTVQSIDADAFGTAHSGEMRLKIAGAAPGDRLTVRTTHRSPHRNVVWCDVVNVLARGPHFSEPPCPHAAAAGGACSGCPAMHLDKETTAAMKTARVTEALSEHSCAPHIVFHPSTALLGYRNRGHFVAARDKSGHPCLGVYAERSHQIVPLNDCLVLRPAARTLLQSARKWLSESQVPIYPEKDGLRYVTLRASLQGAVLVDLVIAGDKSPKLYKLAERLMSEPPTVGVSYSINNEPGNAIRTAPSKQLVGEEAIVEEMGGTPLRLTAASFSQLNSQVGGAMYTWAQAMSPPAKTIWDLYCGAGGLGLTILRAQPADTVLYGAESAPAAIPLAQQNAAVLNRAAVFQNVNLGDRMPSFPSPPDLAVLNPPRKGLDEPVLNFLKTAKTTHTIIYMSCNPVTFAHDVARLQAAGYMVDEVHAYDMLPMTAHVEVIAKLTR